MGTPIEVDGSFGEGGGQTLRTAVAFAVILDRPVRVTKIRAGRDVPGLKQQHLSTLQTLARIFGGELSGAAVGSQEISFTPGDASEAALTVDMKTAASITLLLQAVVPAVSLSGSRVSLDLRGGTDVPWSPTFDYFTEVVGPAYARLGIRFRADAAKRGYYPRGGGTVAAEVFPSEGISPLDLRGSAERSAVKVVSRCGALPRHVAERQLESMSSSLRAAGVKTGEEVIAEEKADSPGSSVLGWVAEEGRIIGADGIGERGVRAEDVGRRAAGVLASTLATGAAVDTNLADMVAPYLSLAPKPSSITTPEVSSHLETCLHIASLFTGCKYSWERLGDVSLVTVIPLQQHNA